MVPSWVGPATRPAVANPMREHPGGFGNLLGQSVRASLLSHVRVDNKRKGAIRGSRADEGVRPTLVKSLIVKNSAASRTLEAVKYQEATRRLNLASAVNRFLEVCPPCAKLVNQ